MAGINEQLLDNLKRMGVPMAYGDKVELGNAEVIPVAIATFGFGSGEGEGDFANGKPRLRAGDGGGESSEGGDSERGKHTGGTGAGMGGGGASIPIGAYVSDEFGTRFQPNLIATLIAVLPIALVAAWGLPKFVKALKK